TIVKKLVELFSDHRIEEVEKDDLKMVKDAFHKTDRDQLMELDGYSTYYSKIQQLKQQLEDIQQNHTDAKSQINASIILLKNLSESDVDSESSFDLLAYYKQLVEGQFHVVQWDDAELAVFRSKWDFVFEWKDYFLSYTNRNASETNSDYRNLLRQVFSQLPRVEERTRVNLLARVIANYLKRNNLRGFFDKDVLKCGDDFGDKIQDYCQSAFAFVQLVEEETLNDSPTAINWCKKEYDLFETDSRLAEYVKVGEKNRHFFILTDSHSDLRPANLPNTYQDWFRHITTTNYQLAANNNKQLRRRIRQIAEQIIQSREAIIAELLSS
ncbi:MAG: hypothetical protein AAFV25_16395, partial [Bacteroidota bacterium]